MARLNPLMIAPPLIFAAFVALAAFGMYRDDPQSLPSALIGQTAPALPEKSLPGYPAVTQDMLATGEVTLVNFWASWCPPCRAEHPRLMQLAAQGVPIVGLNFKDTQGPAVKFLEGDGSPYIGVGFDPKGRFAIDWGVTAPPETFIIGKDGTVVFRFAGPLVGSDYEQRFKPAFEKALDGQE